VPEGGTAEFDVRLSAQPAAAVEVAVERTNGDTDITITSGATMIFTTDDWSTDRTVVLACAEDPDSEDGMATIRIRSQVGPVVPDRLVTAVEGEAGPQMAPAMPVTVYPVPFRPGQSALTIDNGVAGGTLEIFDLRGRRVWNASFGGSTSVEWNGDNVDASTVASGRYFILVKDADNRVVEKKTILVVR
jgi:hypothetical protein